MSETSSRPIDIFIEMALVLDLVANRDERFDDNFLYLDLEGAFGLRYYFNQKLGSSPTGS